MGIDAIKATSINTMPQFKAANNSTQAKTETKEYLADKKEREEFKKFDKAFLDTKPEDTPKIIKK